MKKVLIISVSMLALVSCGNRKANKNNAAQEENAGHTRTEVMQDIHSSRNSLDYGGTYEGVIPCADCSGIEVVLTLDYKGNYIKEMTYRGKSSKPFVTEGRYEWNDPGSIITLKGESGPEMYLVGEGRLFMLDTKGNRITGDLADKYILKQIKKIDAAAELPPMSY